MIIAKSPGDRFVHGAKLRAVALIKDDDNMLFIDRMTAVERDKAVQFLDGGHQDLFARVFQIFLQDLRAGVAVRGSFLEFFVLNDGLIVQVLAIDHEQDLLDPFNFGRQLSGLEAGQRLA